jgi:DNA-binding NarL/FixJ family response regulator
MHAHAMVARDAEALEEASSALEHAGLGWFAVDAMVHAVQAYARRQPGDPAPRERLRRLAARYPSLRSPLLAAVEGPALTEREAQVAQLVADGTTARAIAASLGIGVRTVETHVAHAYRKLSVGTRAELRIALLAR